MYRGVISGNNALLGPYFRRKQAKGIKGIKEIG